MKLTSYAICDIGRVRADNQDNLFLNGTLRESFSDTSAFRHGDASDNTGIYAVADGMGGASHGGLASYIAVNEMKKTNFHDADDAMTRYLLERNADICHQMNENNGARMGTTFAGLCVNGDSAVVTNIGDSRVYLLRGEELRQISVDHTAARAKFELGLITEEEVRKHPERNKLTQHLGIFPAEMEIEPHNEQITVCDGDIFLLCSDGLTDMLDDVLILHILNTYNSIEEKAEVLFAEALKKGGKDNITALLVNAHSDEEPSKRRGLFPVKSTYVAVVTLLTFSVAFGFVFNGLFISNSVDASLDTVQVLNSGYSNELNSEGEPESTHPPNKAPLTSESDNTPIPESTIEMEHPDGSAPEPTPEPTPEPSLEPTQTPTPSPPVSTSHASPSSPLMVSIPNVVGKNSSDATDTLTDKGFSVQTEHEYHDSIEIGYVISQHPEAETAFGYEEIVGITVSQGPTPTYPTYLPYE